MISASSVPRLLACPGSARLKHVPYSTEHADAGTDHHAEIEAEVDLGDYDKLPRIVQEMIQPGDVMATECAFIYSTATDTARELGHIRHRDYPALSIGDIPGTIDLLIMSADRKRATVVDHKSYAEVAAADVNAQTLTYSLMVARAYGLDEVTVVIGYKLRAPSVAVLSSLDLDSHAARLQRMQLDCAHPRAPLAIGPHCDYCPAFLACPEQRALKAQYETDAAVLEPLTFDDDAEAADAFDLLQRIKLLATRISSQLYARAAERPLRLNNGKILGRVAKDGNRKIDGDKAYALVLAKHGAAVADKAARRVVSQESIEEALKTIAPRGKLAGMHREVMKFLESTGAITQKPSTPIEQYDPGDKRAIGAVGESRLLKAMP